MLNGETCSITVTNERMPLRKQKNKERTYYLSYTLHGKKYNRNTKKSSWHNVLTAALVLPLKTTLSIEMPGIMAAARIY